MFPKATISLTIYVLVHHLDGGFPKGRCVPKGTLTTNASWVELLDLATFFLESLLRQVDIFNATGAT